MRIRGGLLLLGILAAGLSAGAAAQASPPQSGETAQSDKIRNSLTPEKGSAVPKATEVDWPWCDCEEKEKAAQEKYDNLLSDYNENYDDLQEKEGAIEIVKQSFYYLTLTWVKKSLYNLCITEKESSAKNAKTIFTHFKDADACDAILPPRTGTIERELAYDEAVVNAVKDFQCDFHPQTSTDECDVARATGWITYEEARDAVCKAGFEAKDDVAITLAEWRKEGQVYSENLFISHWLINKLKKSLQTRLHDSDLDESDEQYYLDIEADARQFAYRLEPRFSAHMTRSFSDIAHETGLLKRIIEDGDKLTVLDFDIVEGLTLDLLNQLPFDGAPAAAKTVWTELRGLKNKTETSEVTEDDLIAWENNLSAMRKEIQKAAYTYTSDEVCVDLFVTKLEHDDRYAETDASPAGGQE